jgi:hypothetical protein
MISRFFPASARAEDKAPTALAAFFAFGNRLLRPPLTRLYIKRLSGR